MKSLAELGERDHAMRTGEFACLVRHLGAEKGDWGNACDRARGARASARVISALEQRAAIGAGGGADWGSQLSDFRMLMSAFTDSLRWSSIFYRLLGDGALVRLPFRVQVGAITTAAAASAVGPGAAIPLSKLNITDTTLGERKCAGMLTVSRELLRAGGPAAEALISRSLRRSTSVAVDSGFLGIITTGVVPTNSTGDALADLRTLLMAVGLSDESRPYWLAAPDVGIRLATAGEAQGSPALPGGQPLFSGVSPLGGALLGLPMLVSSTVGAGGLMLVDAVRIGGAADPIDVMASQQADAQMDANPSMQSTATGSPDAPSPAQVVSMFQADGVAIKAVAFYGAVVMLPGGVAAVTGIRW